MRRPRTLWLLAAVTILAAMALTLSPAAPLALSPPPAPTGLTAIALDAKVGLAWKPVAGADGYRVYRGTSAAAITDPLTPSGVTGTSFVDTSATNGATYFYAVHAYTGPDESVSGQLASATPQARSCSSGNDVVVENCFPGTTAWKTDATALNGAHGIEGFLSATSVQAGESVDVRVATGDALIPFHIDVYRTGSYGGSQGRLISTIPGLTGGWQPPCETHPADTGLVDCSSWTPRATVSTTADWPSGVYLLKLVREDDATENEMLLVVRHDGNHSEIAYKVPTDTYQAYNSYDGKSLYDFNSNAPNTNANSTHAIEVSFNRPYAQPSAGSWIHDWYPRTDVAAVSWLESQGYDISYLDDDDVDAAGGQLLDHKVVISGVHDEYWTQGVRDAMTAARDGGTSLVFLGANASFWRIRYAAGTNRRHLVEYKTIQGAPNDPDGPTTTWRDPAGPNQPENSLIGQMYIGDGPNYFPLRVSAAEGQDRVWRYTSLGDQAPGTATNVGTELVGWEWDSRGQTATEPAGLRTLSSSPVTGGIIQNGGAVNIPGSATANTTIYEAPSGALVFATGTQFWSRGLADNGEGAGEANGRIRQATANVLADMGAHASTPSGVTADQGGAPQVTGSTPADGAASVPVASAISVTFDRELDRETVNGTTVTLTAGGNPVAATVSLDEPTKTVTVNPTGSLVGNTSYTLHLAGSIATWGGTTMTGPVAITFTTGPTAPLTLTSSDPANAATGVATDADIHATFSGPVDPASVSESTFTVQAGAGPAIPATVSYDANSRTAKLVAASPLTEATTYTARLAGILGPDGEAMATTTFSFTTAANLTVTDHTPADLATGVSQAVRVRVTFSRAVNDATLSDDHLKLTDGFDQIPSQITYDPNTHTATITPNAPLTLLSTYHVIVTAGVRATDGASTTPTTWSFTTGESAVPAVTTLFPADAAEGVFNGTAVKATFDQAMDPASITSQTFTLKPDVGPAVAAAVSYDAGTHQAILTPLAALAVGAHYTATLTTGVTTPTGTPLAENVIWTFTTGQCPCSLLAGQTPAEIGIPGTFELGVRITSQVDTDLVALRYYRAPGEPGSHIGKVWDATGTLLGQVSFANETPSGWQRQALDTPVRLTAGQVYTVSVNVNAWWVKTGYVMRDPITSGPLSSVGDGLNGVYNDLPGSFPASMYLWSNYFVDPVVRLPDSPVHTPEISSTTPSDGATGVAAGATVRTVFNHPLDPSTVTPANFRLATAGDATVPSSLSYNDDTRTVTLTPTNPLVDGTSYTMHVATGVRSDDETPLADAVSWSFATNSGVPPSVTGTSPASGATGISPSSSATVTFDQRMDPATITPSTITLTPTGGSPVPATVTYQSSTHTATLAPSGLLSSLTTYTLDVSTGAKNEAGQALQSASSSSFTTSNGCPCRLFPDDPAPATTALDTRNGRSGTGPFSLEMGVKFQVNVASQLVAVRFRRDPWETGTHTANIWTGDGTLIATIPFTNETPNPWQRQVLSSPLSLTPGQVYVASVGMNGRFSMTAGSILATGVSNGPVASVVDNANGVFADAAGTFPTQSWNNSNYFIDVDVQ